MKSKLLIKNIIVNGAPSQILIEGAIIKQIGGTHSSLEAKIIDGRGMVALPGLVNMHTHSPMTLMRGVGEDLSLNEWLNDRIWPLEKRLDDELIYWGTKLAILEMFKSGTTTFNDQYWSQSISAKAAAEMGIRSFHSFVILDLGEMGRSDKIKENAIKAYEESHSWGELNHFTIGLHSPYSVSEEMLVWGSQFAQEHNLLVHIHLSETEKENLQSLRGHSFSPTHYLDKLGMLNSKVIAAHSLWIDDSDIELLAKKGVTVVHNINSNLKLGSGYRFLYNELHNAGVNVTLGTDGCASSNNLDMLEAMKTAALLQKGWRGDPKALPLNELLNIATINGAKALGLNGGVIEEGALADLILIDTNNHYFTPNINFLSNLIYSANSSCVDSVICNGKVVMENRHVEGEEEILLNVRRVAERFYK